MSCRWDEVTLTQHETQTSNFYWHKQLEPTCTKPPLTSFPPSAPCWRLLIWSFKEITWKEGDKTGKRVITMHYFSSFILHTKLKNPWDTWNHLRWVLPLEKTSQVDPLTRKPSQGPRGASLAPVKRQEVKQVEMTSQNHDSSCFRVTQMDLPAVSTSSDCPNVLFRRSKKKSEVTESIKQLTRVSPQHFIKVHCVVIPLNLMGFIFLFQTSMNALKGKLQ